MRVFELVREALDEEFERIPGSTEAEKFEQIKSKISYNSALYNNILAQGEKPDFSDPACRFGYIFSYVTAYANTLADRLTSNEEICKILEKKAITISCIGGGPGSDIIGIIKFLIQNEYSGKVLFNTIDREKAWSEVWADLYLRLDSDLSFSAFSMPLEIDVSNSDTWRLHHKYFNADFFTISYFLSEIYSQKSEVTPYFEKLFNSAKIGALFAIQDFDHDATNAWISDIASAAGLTKIYERRGRDVIEPAEQKEVLAKYISGLGWNPKVQSCVQHIHFEKTGMSD